MVWRQEKVLRTNLQPNPTFRASAGYTTVRTNLVPGGFSVDTNADGVADGWLAYNSGTSSAISYSVVNGAQRIKATLGTDNLSRCGVRADVPPGYVYAGMPVQVKLDMWGTFTTGQNVRVYVDWRNASGTLTGTTQFATAVSTIGSSSKTFSATLSAIPSGTTAGVVYVWTEGGTTAGDCDLYVDNLIVETASTLGNFFDGASANGSFDSNLESVWTGISNASPSAARGQTPADWTMASSSWKSWIAEDGKSTYLRYVGAAAAGIGTGAMYTALAQTVPAKSTVSASLKVLGTNPLYMSIQGYGGAGETSSYGPAVSNGDVSSMTHTFNNPDVNGVRLIARVPVTPPGTTYQITQALLEVSPTVGTYFDGSYPNVLSGASYRWNGTADRSQSSMYIPALMSPPAGLWDSSQYGYSESWLVDGVDIQSMAFGVTTVESTPPDLRGGHLSIPGRNGVLPQFNRSYEPGSVTLKMWVLGCDTDGVVPGTRTGRRQLFERNLRALIRLFGYQGNTITLSRTLFGDYLDSSVPNKVTARAIVEGFTSIETMMARQRAEMTVVLTLVDSFWSDVDKTTDSTTASATVPQTLNISNTGTAPIDDSIITITGPITAPKITCAASGSWIQYNDALAAGQTLVIDSGNGTAKVGNTSVITKVAHGGTSRFMVIPPRDSSIVTDLGFTPALTMTGTSASSATKFSVSYNRKHLVIV